MADIKTIAVSELVWSRLKEIMKREKAKSMNEVVAKLLEETSRMPQSRFGVHKNLKFTQEEHEEITRNLH
ncbi:MAG: hypothetical protein QXL25_01210 [Candidatus Bathyarchaeia archaeon]